MEAKKENYFPFFILFFFSLLFESHRVSFAFVHLHIFFSFFSAYPRILPVFAYQFVASCKARREVEDCEFDEAKWVNVSDYKVIFEDDIFPRLWKLVHRCVYVCCAHHSIRIVRSLARSCSTSTCVAIQNHINVVLCLLFLFHATKFPFFLFFTVFSSSSFLCSCCFSKYACIGNNTSTCTTSRV